MYTSKEYVNAKQIMLSRCVEQDQLLTANCYLLGEKYHFFPIFKGGGGGGGGALIAATNVTCAVQACVFCIFFWKVDGKK